MAIPNTSIDLFIIKLPVKINLQLLYQGLLAIFIAGFAGLFAAVFAP